MAHYMHKVYERHHSTCVCDKVIWFAAGSKLVPVARSWPPAKRKKEAFNQESPITYRERKVETMDASRRDFLKASALGGAALSFFGFDLAPAYAQLRELKIARASETRSTCPYCSVSCGVIIYTIGDNAKNVTPQVIHVEGDPDHPINRGTLCPKGASLEQDILNPRRLLKLRSLGGHCVGPGD
jgi:hypothetical protein